MRRNVSRFASRVGGQFGQAGANTMRHARRLALGSVVALTAATAAAARFGDRIDKMSKRTGIGVETLSKLAYASSIAGSSIEDVEKAIARQQLGLKQASDGLTTATRGYNELGLSVEELMQMSPEEQFFATAKAIADVDDASRRAALAQEMLGRGGRKVIPLLTSDFKALAAAAARLGVIITPEQAEAAAELTDDIHDLKSSLLGVALSMGVLEPASEILKEITDRIVKMRDSGAMAKFAKSMKDGAREIIASARGIGGAWGEMDSEQRAALSRMAKASGAFVLAWTLGFVRPMLTITGAFVARMVMMLNPAVILAPLTAWAGYLLGLGINKSLEKHLNLSSALGKVIVGVQALGGILATTFKAAVFDPIMRLGSGIGQALSALLEGEFEEAQKIALRMLGFNGGMDRDKRPDEIAELGAEIKAAWEKAKSDFEAIDEMEPAGVGDIDFDDSVMDIWAAEFAKAIETAEQGMAKLADKLAGDIGLTEGADALKAFIAEMNRIKDEQLAIGFDTGDFEKGAKQINDVDAALGNLERSLAPFRGGKILSMDIGAVIGPALQQAQAKLAAAQKPKREAPERLAPSVPIWGPPDFIHTEPGEKISTPYGDIQEKLPIKPQVQPPIEPPIIKSPAAESANQVRGDFAGIGETLANIHGTLKASLGVQKQIADSGVIMGFV